MDAGEFVTPVSGQPADGTFEISFIFTMAEEVVASDEVAIWLEIKRGQFH